MNTQFRIGDGGGDGEYGKIYTYIGSTNCVNCVYEIEGLSLRWYECASYLWMPHKRSTSHSYDSCGYHLIQTKANDARPTNCLRCLQKKENKIKTQRRFGLWRGRHLIWVWHCPKLL